jgi:hypothetical protein
VIGRERAMSAWHAVCASAVTSDETLEQYPYTRLSLGTLKIRTLPVEVGWTPTRTPGTQPTRTVAWLQSGLTPTREVSFPSTSARCGRTTPANVEIARGTWSQMPHPPRDRRRDNHGNFARPNIWNPLTRGITNAIDRHVEDHSAGPTVPRVLVRDG